MIFLISACINSGGGSSDNEEEFGGVYWVGINYDNCSYISFSAPNEYHSDYISWTANKNNGSLSHSCKTKGTYSVDGNSIFVSGFYNSSCRFVSDRNGTWRIDGKDHIIDPEGGRWRKKHFD